VRDQALFTVWTLRKISALAEKISDKEPVSEDQKGFDTECVKQFCTSMTWTNFHLGCLITAIRFDKSIYPEVLSEIIDGLRAAVNAYAWIRQGVDIRFPIEEPIIKKLDWDEEDQELLDSSMSSLDNHTDGD
jgi:hypothetical protein